MKEKYKGIIYIIISAFFFAVMGFFVKLAGDLPVFEKAFFRNLVSLVMSCAMLKKAEGIKALDKGDCRVLFLRSFFGSVGVLCNFYAVDHLLLADAGILNKLSPFFALLISALVLKEKLKPFQIICVVTAFFGALLVIKPGSGIVAFPAVIGFLGGASAGCAYTMVRLLGKRGVAGPYIVFFFSAFSCLIIAPFMILDFKPMSLLQLTYLLLAGLSAAFGQFAITSAYCHAPAREISVFDYSQIIFSAILGFIAFHQIPDTLSFAGYAVIILTAVANFIFNNKSSEKA